MLISMQMQHMIFKQMEQIRLGLEHGIDVTKLLNPLIPSDVMMNMRLESEALKKVGY